MAGNEGHAWKKKTTPLGDETYRILADLHYCRQTVKRRMNRENHYNWTSFKNSLTGKQLLVPKWF